MSTSHKISSTFVTYFKKLTLWTLCLVCCILIYFILFYFLPTSSTDKLLNDINMGNSKIATKILDRNGKLIGSFAEENRIIIPFQDIPPAFIYAIIATEDADFMNHNGVSLRGIMRAGYSFISSLGKRREGASTLTMQLVRVITSNRKRSINRKIKEMILAIRLEKKYSKKQIIEQYTNEVYFGGGCYGLEVAAQFYFGKRASQLTTDECALLAGLIQNPNGYNPYNNNLKTKLDTKARRNHVLKRMVYEGYLSNVDYVFFIDQPIKLIHSKTHGNNLAAYAIEEVRKYLYTKYGRTLVLNGGLEITTTIDTTLQQAAENAIRSGLHVISKLRGFNFDNMYNVSNPENIQLPNWNRFFVVGDVVQGVIIQHYLGATEVRIGVNHIIVPDSAFAWVGNCISSILKRGNVVWFIVKDVKEGGIPKNLELYQEPDLEGALLSIEPQTGEIRAMVGGYDFNRSKFNRAIQAERQVGSLMKPFVYGAAFVKGKTPAYVLNDIPTEFIFGNVHYKPHNYERNFGGPMTIWKAICDSRNIPAVDMLNEVGINNVINFAYSTGINKELIPYPSLALGACELTLKDIVHSYGTFANNGIQTPQPYLIKKITDRRGNILENHENQSSIQAIDPISNYHILQCLHGVAQKGTGAKSNILKYPLAGKTGTTNNYTDAWYVGFSTRIVCGVWIGLDTKKTIIDGGSGSKLALPIWIDFMRIALHSIPREEFIVPFDVEWRDIDIYTGLIASRYTKDINKVRLAFKKGTAPTNISDRNSIDLIEKSKNNIKYNSVKRVNWLLIH